MEFLLSSEFILDNILLISRITVISGLFFSILSAFLIILILYKSFKTNPILISMFLSTVIISIISIIIWGESEKMQNLPSSFFPSKEEVIIGEKGNQVKEDPIIEKEQTKDVFIFPWNRSKSLLTSSEKKDILTIINLEKVNTVYSLLSKYYVSSESIEAKKLEEGLINGIIYAIDDPYTQFFNDEQSEEFKQSMKGDFEGIGAVLEKQKKLLTISEVLKGRPAADSGLLPGDIILKVDDKELNDESVYDSVLRIRGEKNTVVTLEIYRPSKSKKIVIPITRATIHVESVTLEWKGENKNIAVFEISQFGDEMIKEFKKVFYTAIDNKPKGIIIDLRYNGGGYLSGAVDLASFFLPPNTKVVTVKDKQENEDISYTSVQLKQSLETPVIVLINGGSASASEIFAGAISDNKRGKLLGEKTFGKGSVQQIFPLSDKTNEEIKITIAKWFTPSGKNPTQDDPMTPDIIVEFDRTEMTDQQREEKYDPQLEEAINQLQ